MLQVRQLSLVTSHPYLPFCKHIIPTLHFNVLGLYFCHLFFVIKSYPCNYLSRECGLHKASDLLRGDHACEKSDAVYHLFDYVMLMSSNYRAKQLTVYVFSIIQLLYSRPNLYVAINLLHSRSDLIMTFSRASLFWAVKKIVPFFLLSSRHICTVLGKQ